VPVSGSHSVSPAVLVLPAVKARASGDPNPVLPPTERRHVPAWTVRTAHGASDTRKFRDGSGIVDGGRHAENLRPFEGFLRRAHPA
jgi:hypothetical protein